MRRGRWLVLVIAIFPGCDIAFVAVQEAQHGYVVLRSEHGSDFRSSLEVSLPETGQPPLVLIDENQLQGEARDGRWWYRTEPLIDTLLPRLDLEIRTDHVVATPLPLVTRNGPAIRRENGDLELPVVYGGEAGDPQLTWRVVLVDSSGRQLITLHSRSAPFPSPIVLSSALLPTTAVAAEITASRQSQLADAMYPLNVTIQSVLRVPIPAASTEAGADRDGYLDSPLHLRAVEHSPHDVVPSPSVDAAAEEDLAIYGAAIDAVLAELDRASGLRLVLSRSWVDAGPLDVPGPGDRAILQELLLRYPGTRACEAGSCVPRPGEVVIVLSPLDRRQRGSVRLHMVTEIPPWEDQGYSDGWRLTLRRGVDGRRVEEYAREPDDVAYPPRAEASRRACAQAMAWPIWTAVRVPSRVMCRQVTRMTSIPRARPSCPSDDRRRIAVLRSGGRAPT